MNQKVHSPSKVRWHGEQRRIGITGGIASGKSSLGQFLKEVKNLPTLDADKFAKQILSEETSAKKEVINRYGSSITLEKRNNSYIINRDSLGKIIFNDYNERIWLEGLIHPIVKKEFQKELIKLQNEPIIILIIPLLFEANFSNLCSEVWMINCHPTQQLNRLISRDNLSKSDALKRIEAQLSLKEKANLSDVVIDNSLEPKRWIPYVDKLLKFGLIA